MRPSTRRRRLITTVTAATVALVALMGIFAACSDDDDDAGGTAPESTRAATQAPTATAAPKIGGSMILATTTSTQDTGLLDALMPRFKEQTGIDVKVIAVGTGAALEMGAKGDADAVLVHAPASEKKYVDAGDLIGGKLVMHNDFVVVGPPSDPAKVRGERDLSAAMKRLAESGAFVSRGDNSGTHTKELQLWQAAGIDPKTVKNREETGSGMGATLNVADQKGAYQPWPLSDGNGPQIAPSETGFLECPACHLVDVLDMSSRGEFRHHSAESLMHGLLR